MENVRNGTRGETEKAPNAQDAPPVQVFWIYFHKGEAKSHRGDAEFER